MSAETVRARETLLLAGMLVRFFVRRVLSVGLLRSRPARWTLLVVAVATQAGLTAVSLLALRDLFAARETLRLLLESTALTVGFVTLIAFVFVKLLFLKSSNVLDFTEQLPTTDRERSTALLLFEAAMVMAAAATVVAPLAVSSTVVVGGTGAAMVLAAVVYPMLVFYLCLALGYNAVVRLLLVLGWARAAQLVSATIFAVLIFVYQGQINSLIDILTSAYLEGTTAHTGFNVFLVLADRSALLSTAVFLVSAVLLTGLVAITAPALPLAGRRYLRVPVPGVGSTRFAAYLAAVVRRWETAFAAVLALGAAAYLISVGSDVVAYASGFLLFECIFAYVASRPLADIGPAPDGPARRLGMILAAQAVVVLVVSAPISIAALAVGNAPSTVGQFYGTAASAILVLVAIGIALPPEKDNPFSVFLGLALAAVTVSMVLLMVGLLAVPLPALVALLVVGHGLVAFYSYAGIRSLERLRRHEAVGLLG